LEILRLLVEGASDPEIAARLFISRKTASNHVHAILKKLGVSSRSAAAALAVRRGLDRAGDGAPPRSEPPLPSSE
jgi:DNA-binding NarL/FixJ family response regulator